MASDSPLKDKAVLVVDDEPDILHTIEEMLDMCQVHKAADYNTAVQHLLGYTYDIVILDIQRVSHSHAYGPRPYTGGTEKVHKTGCCFFRAQG